MPVSTVATHWMGGEVGFLFMLPFALKWTMFAMQPGGLAWRMGATFGIPMPHLKQTLEKKMDPPSDEGVDPKGNVQCDEPPRP